MEEISIEDLASYLVESKSEGRANPIIFLGAGASVSGGIPLASGIEEEIKKKYPNNSKASKLADKDKNYTKLMACLSPNQRNELLDDLIGKAKINVTHIYLAQLIESNFIDYVLTVNFDNLMLRALALFDIFPPVYDLTTIGDLTTSKLKEKSVVYLHGRHHGVWLLNTDDEMSKVKTTVPKIFSEIKDRPWIFLGYSGNDPIFDHVQELGRFDNNMYWVGHDDNPPIKKVQDFLSKSNTEAHFIRGYDADAFMLKLNNELNLPQPNILNKPFSTLKKMLLNIVDINDEDHFIGVRERLEIAKSSTETAIRIFEKGEMIDVDPLKMIANNQKQEIIRMIISEDFEESKVNKIQSLVETSNDEDTNILLADLYVHIGNKYFQTIEKQGFDWNQSKHLYQQAFDKYRQALSTNPNNYKAAGNWAVILGKLAETKSEEEAENIYEQSFDKYKQALAIDPEGYEALINWGISLEKIAETKSEEEAETFYEQAIDKYKQALAIKPDSHKSLSSWGSALSGIAETKSEEEAETFYEQAFDKYEQALAIKPDNYQILLNWGISLERIAETKSAKEAEPLYQQAFDKYEKLLAIKPDSYKLLDNWVVTLIRLADNKSVKEAEVLYLQAADKCKQALTIKPDSHGVLNNWGYILVKLADTKLGENAEDLYLQAADKYEQALTIKPDSYNMLINWAIILNKLAKTKSGDESEALYQQAFDKYQQALTIQPDSYEVLSSWGVTLAELAGTKSGDESEALYQQAFDKFQQALTIKPSDYETLINWGVSLGKIADTKSGDESETLYQKAFDKYEQALTINPDNYTALSNWSFLLFSFSKNKIKPESTEILKEGLIKAQLAHKHGGDNYNLACYYAVTGCKLEALELLETSLKNKEISTMHILENENWQDYLDDESFKKLIKQYGL